MGRINIQNLKRVQKMMPQTEGLTRTQKDWLAHFDKAVDAYMANARSNNVSDTTYRNYGDRIRQFRIYMIDKEGCADITPERIYGFRTWLTERGLGTSTIRQYLLEVLAFLDWTTWDEHKYYDIKIPPHILPKTRKNGYNKMLTPDEIMKLIAIRHSKDGKPILSAPYIRRRAVAIIMLTMGLRVSEVCSLCAKDIDLDKGTLYVAHGKGDKQRLLNIPKVAYETIQIYMEEGNHPDFRQNPEIALFGSYHDGEWRRLIRQHMAILVNDYGLECIGKRLNPHLLRHAAASFTYLNGASLEEVRQFLGHSEQSTTRIYLQKLCQSVSAPGIENIWNRMEYESEKGVREVEEQKGIKIRRINVVERTFVMVATDGNGDEYELEISAESEESARMKGIVYCNREGLTPKKYANGNYYLKEKEEK